MIRYGGCKKLDAANRASVDAFLDKVADEQQRADSRRVVEIMQRKHKASGGCVHIKKLTDIDEKILEKLIKDYLAFIKKGGI